MFAFATDVWMFAALMIELICSPADTDKVTKANISQLVLGSGSSASVASLSNKLMATLAAVLAECIDFNSGSRPTSAQLSARLAFPGSESDAAAAKAEAMRALVTLAQKAKEEAAQRRRQREHEPKGIIADITPDMSRH